MKHLKTPQELNESSENLNISESSKNIWLEKLKEDLLQNKYNLNKVGLYNGLLKEGIENLLESLKDYDIYESFENYHHGDPFGKLIGESFFTEDGDYEVYFDENYIELIETDMNKYVDRFPYPEELETVEGNGEYELYFEGSYLEFIKNDKIVTTFHLDEDSIKKAR